jgi:hypothetical protein
VTLLGILRMRHNGLAVFIAVKKTIVATNFSWNKLPYCTVVSALGLLG